MTLYIQTAYLLSILVFKCSFSFLNFVLERLQCVMDYGTISMTKLKSVFDIPSFTFTKLCNIQPHRFQDNRNKYKLCT